MNEYLQMMLQWLIAQQNQPQQPQTPQRRQTSPVEDALAQRLQQPNQPLDLASLVREARNTPVQDARNAYQARQESDPWGSGGAFEGRSAADLLSPTALAASQGRTAANQWAMVTGQGGGEGVDVPTLTSLLSGNNPARVAQRQQTINEQKQSGAYRPPGRVIGVDRNNYTIPGSYPAGGNFERMIPGTATAANPSGNWWTASSTPDLPPGATMGDEKNTYAPGPLGKLIATPRKQPTTPRR